MLVKLCTRRFLKFRASEILSTCYPRNGLYLEIGASEILTSEIRASQGPPVQRLLDSGHLPYGVLCFDLVVQQMAKMLMFT